MPGKKILSYALFEHASTPKPDVPFYERILPATLRSAKALYPDFEVRIHHDNSIYRNWYGDVLVRLAEREDVKLVYVDETEGRPLGQCALWRLLPLWEPDAEYVFCRDIDSVVTYRERCCVEEFIQSGMILHSISDHVQHECPMMAGMIGFNAYHFRQLLNFGAENFETAMRMDHGVDWSHKNADQQLLMYNFWPKMKHVALCHWLGGAKLDARDVRKVATELPSAKWIETFLPKVPKINAGARFIGDVADETGAIEAYDVWGRQQLQKVSGYGTKAAQGSWEVKNAEETCGIDQPHYNLIPVAERTPPRRYTVLSSDFSPDYMFYLPLASMLWRTVVGRTPLIILIGTAEEWLTHYKGKLVVAACRQAGAIIHFVPRIDGYRSSTVAKASRLYASLLPGLDPSDELMISDADLLPLERSFFERHDTQKHAMSFYFANAMTHDKEYPDVYPMCHMVATTKNWREAMGCAGRGPHMIECMEDDLGEEVGKYEDTKPEYRHRNGAGLFSDETYFATFLRAWSQYAGSSPKNVQFIDRERRPSGCPVGRKDKVDWDIKEPATDAHGYRPGWSDEHFGKLDALLVTLIESGKISTEQVREFYEFKEAFTR